jgi:hypothetical protein
MITVIVLFIFAFVGIYGTVDMLRQLKEEDEGKKSN